MQLGVYVVYVGQCEYCFVGFMFVYQYVLVMLVVGSVEVEFVGEVVIEEYWQVVVEGQVLYYFLYCMVFVVVNGDEFDYMVVRLQVVIGVVVYVVVGEGVYIVGGVWCVVLVQCQVDIFVFYQYVGMVVGEVYCLLVQCVQLFGGVVIVFVVQYVIILFMQFMVMQVCSRQLQWSEQLIQLFEWVVIDQCYGIFQVVVDVVDGFVYIWQQLYGIWVCSEFDQGVVDIEE